MKGLFKGFKYVAHIFDEKEPEMEIGFPKDVKHVAHIGWDGPSASKPSWMNEYKSSPEISNGVPNCIEELHNLAILQPPSEDMSQVEKPKHKSRHTSCGTDSPRSQSSNGTDSPLNSPTKHSRRNRSANNSMDSPSRDPTARNTRRHRHHHHHIANPSVESPARDYPSIPKHSKGRKTKESKSKEKNSSAADRHGPQGSETAHAPKNYASHLSSVLEAYEEV